MKKTVPVFRDFGPVPWWCWNGRMKKSEMSRQLRLFKENGIDEYFIYAQMPLEYPEYLSGEWFDFVGFALEESRRLNMRVWIYDDYAWPSGAAGGRVFRDHPEFRSRIIYGGHAEVAPGKCFTYTDGPRPLCVFVGTDGTRWERVSTDDENRWRNSLGKTAYILFFDIRPGNFSELSSRCGIGMWDQRGSLDFLNPEAVRGWMGYIHEEYERRFGSLFGTLIRGFFFDEPMILSSSAYWCEGNCIPFTPGLFERFTERFGYSLPDVLPAIFYDAPESVRTRCDYWELVSGMAGEGFGRTLGDWCAERNLISTGHFMCEEPAVQRMRLHTNGEIYRMMKHQQAPGCDLLCYLTPWRKGNIARFEQILAGGGDAGAEIIYTVKQPASAARYTGAARVLAEAFGCRGASETLAEQKDIHNFLAAMGISLLNDNMIAYAGSGHGKYPVSSKLLQAWFPFYSLYSEACRRLSEFAAFGYLDTEIAVLQVETALRAGTPMAPVRFDPICAETMPKTLSALLKNHIGFELLFEEVLENAIVKDGRLEVPNAVFRLVIVPAGRVLTGIQAERLAELVRNGGKVVFTGCRPERLKDRPLTPGEEEFFRAQPCISAEDEHFTEDLVSSVRTAVPQKYRVTGESAGNFCSALRSDGKQTRLFVSNQGEEPASVRLHPESLPGPVIAHDTDTGASWKAVPDADGSLPLELYPEQSLVFEFSAEEAPSPATPPAHFGFPACERKVLSGDWEYELDRPNTTLCPLEIGPAPGNAREDPERVKCWFGVSASGRHTFRYSREEYPFCWLKSGFFADAAFPGGLSLILDNPEDYDRILLNGVPLTETEPCRCWNQDNRLARLDNALRSGFNVMYVRMKTSRWASKNMLFQSAAQQETNFVDPVALSGMFAARKRNGELHLEPLPGALSSGDLEKCGLSQFTGNITFRRRFRLGKDTLPGRIMVRQECTHCLEVLLNGKSLGKRAWHPWLFDAAGTVKPGENELAVVLSGSLANLLRISYFDINPPVPLGLREIVLCP